MGTSSYDRVCELLVQSPEWRDFADCVRRRLQTWRVARVGWEVRDAHNPRPYFRYTFDGATKEYSSWRNDRNDMLQYQVDLDDVANYEEMAKVAKRVWDRKGVPTYNCRFQKAKDAPKDQKCVENEFPQFGRMWIREKFSEDIAAASRRVTEAALALYDRPDFAAVMAEAVEAAAVNEIKAALLKFRHLDESILRRAFMEFVTQDVLES